MSEDDLLKTVLEMTRLFGLLAAHFRPAQAESGNWITAVQGDGKGYVDLTIVGPGGILFRELKSAKGVLSPEQKIWVHRLQLAGADVGVWRPADLASYRIKSELQLIRKAIAS